MGQTAVEQTGKETIGGQLKGHGQGSGEHGRKAAGENRAHQGSNKAHQSAPGAAAEKAAQQHRQVHGQQHRADLGNVSREEGEYIGQSQHKGGQDQALDAQTRRGCSCVHEQNSFTKNTAKAASPFGAEHTFAVLIAGKCRDKTGAGFCQAIIGMIP